MSLGITSFGSSFAPVRNERPRRPFVLDETLPKTRDPQEVMKERMEKRLLEQIKNKPENERTFFDYLFLAQDKLKNNPIIKPEYYA